MLRAFLEASEDMSVKCAWGMTDRKLILPSGRGCTRWSLGLFCSILQVVCGKKKKKKPGTHLKTVSQSTYLHRDWLKAEKSFWFWHDCPLESLTCNLNLCKEKTMDFLLSTSPACLCLPHPWLLITAPACSVCCSLALPISHPHLNISA